MQGLFGASIVGLLGRPFRDVSSSSFFSFLARSLVAIKEYN